MGIKSGKWVCWIDQFHAQPVAKNARGPRPQRNVAAALHAPSDNRTHAHRPCCSSRFASSASAANRRPMKASWRKLLEAVRGRKAALFRPVLPLFPDRRRPAEARDADRGQSSRTSSATDRRSSSHAIVAHARRVGSLRHVSECGPRQTPQLPALAASRPRCPTLRPPLPYPAAQPVPCLPPR